MLGEIYYQNNFLNDEECSVVKNHMIAHLDEAHRPLAGYSPYNRINFTQRLSKNLFVDPKDPKFKAITNKVVDTVRTANENIFLFDVDFPHFMDAEHKHMWISMYDGEEKSHWAKHQRVNWISNYMQTKLIASVVLSDPEEYEGGDLIFSFGSTKELPTPNETRGKGLLYVYPAFRYFQINPVLTGQKYHLDFMFSGPYWR